jgi:hypothetical protein
MIEPFLKIEMPLPNGYIHIIELDEDAAEELLNDMEIWGDDCSQDSKDMREALRVKFANKKIAYQNLQIGDLVEVIKDGWTKGKTATVSEFFENIIEVSFDHQWIGWYSPDQLKKISSLHEN